MPMEFANKYEVKLEQGEDGLGELEYCVLNISNIKFLATSHKSGPEEAKLMNISISSTEFDFAKALDALLVGLSIKHSDLIHIQEEAGQPKWALYRQDDNDNEFEMERFYLKETAEGQASFHQKKGHKQYYYVKKTT